MSRWLWPGREQPGSLFRTQDVADMLRATPRRVDALLESAVWAGAQTTLMITRSWYPGYDLQAPIGLRAGSEADLDESWPTICRRAAEIQKTVNPKEYTPLLGEDGTPVPAATFSELIYSSSSAEPDVTPEGTCRTTETSRSSGADYEDSASSEAPTSPAATGKGKQSAEVPQPRSTEGTQSAPAGASSSAPATGPSDDPPAA